MIYLVNMPFASITYPNLALGLFKSQFLENKIDCRILDLNLYFARLIGYGGYQNIARFKNASALFAESTATA
ncbi:MAG: hypothetical protein GY749_39625 [Desulfobacteraceae bacterium]|nr:hypothetical protein [Desulfobacteraceae bacterium]